MSCTSQQTAEVRLDQDSALLQSTTTLCVEETTYDGIHLEAAVSLVLRSLWKCLGAQQVAPVSIPNLSLPWTVLAWTTRCRRCYWEKVRGPKMDSISGFHLAPKDKHVAHVCEPLLGSPKKGPLVFGIQQDSCSPFQALPPGQPGGGETKRREASDFSTLEVHSGNSKDLSRYQICFRVSNIPHVFAMRATARATSMPVFRSHERHRAELLGLL